MGPDNIDAGADNDTGLGNDEFDSTVDAISSALGFGQGNDDEGGEGGDDRPTDEEKPTGDEAPKPGETPTPKLDEKPTPAADAPKMPGSWSAKAELWTAASPELQAMIAQREADFHAGLEGYKEHAGIGKAITELFAPYGEVLKANNLDQLAVTKNLLDSQATLAFGTPEQKAALVRDIIQTYEIDPAELGLAVGDDKPADEAVKTLQESNRALQSRLDQMQRVLDSQQQLALRDQVKSFLSNPAFPHAKTLSADIAGLIKADPNLTLEAAYEKALWLNPETRKAQLKAEADANAAAEAKKLKEQQDKLRSRTPRIRDREVKQVSTVGGRLENLANSVLEEIGKSQT